MMVINACFFHKLYSPPGPLRHKADLGEKKERKKLFSHQRDVESSDVADRISHEARGGAVAGVGGTYQKGGAGGLLRSGLREWSFVSNVWLSRMMAEDIKDMSKHCYLALSFAPSV